MRRQDNGAGLGDTVGTWPRALRHRALCVGYSTHGAVKAACTAHASRVGLLAAANHVGQRRQRNLAVGQALETGGVTGLGGTHGVTGPL